MRSKSFDKISSSLPERTQCNPCATDQTKTRCKDFITWTIYSEGLDLFNVLPHRRNVFLSVNQPVFALAIHEGMF